MHDVAIWAYQSSMYFLFVSVLWWTIKLATRLVLVLPALLLNVHQRHWLRQSVWQWDCIIIRYYKSQQILHLYTMKVIYNLIVTSLTSASAQKLHSRVQVLKNSTRECAREMLAHYKNFTLECVRSTRARECELALNLYHTFSKSFSIFN